MLLQAGTLCAPCGWGQYGKSVRAHHAAMAHLQAPRLSMEEVPEYMSWEANEYAWDPHRLVAVRDSSADSLHMGISAARTQPDSVVPPVLGSTPACSEKAAASPGARCKVRQAT